MLRNIQNMSVHIFIIFIGCFVNKSCGSGNFLFKQKTLPFVNAREKIKPGSPWWFSGSGEKQQLCHLARMETNLPYMDYNITYDWLRYDHYGLINVMRCPTLPTMFVLKEDYKDIIQITFLESRINDILFDTQVIKRFDFISQKVEALNEPPSKPSRIAQLSAEDRKNLCDAAKKFVSVVFLDNLVLEAKRYKFSTLSHQEETHLSLVCPTSPKLCLYDGDLVNEVKLLVVRDSVNLYTFEMDEAEPASVLPCKVMNLLKNFNANDLVVLDSNDRVKLCTIAREYASLPGTDTIVHKAEIYSFRFEDGTEVRDIAIRCPKLPEFYLRLADPLEYTIKIIFLKNPYKRYLYTTEFFDFINPTKDTEASRKQLKQHWFSTLSEDARWKLCYAAQKQTPHFLRLQTAPRSFIEPPSMKAFTRRYPIGGIREVAEDVAIKCSGLPETYVRIIQQSKDVDTKIMQIVFRVDYFDIPVLRTQVDDYHEEQDDYDGQK